MTTREELEAQAEELGIKVDGRWSDERLQAKIDEALAEDKEEGEADTSESQEYESEVIVKKYATRHNGKFIAGDVLFEPGKPMELTASQLKNKQISHAIKTGMIEAL